MDERPQGVAARGRSLAILVVITLAGLGALATWRGADRSRAPLDARALVQETLRLALAEGNRSPVVLDQLRRLRRELGHRPLDSKSRVQYAALLLSMTRRLDDTRAAMFHARVAADLAPVTLPVVELTALILARGGDPEGALLRVRDIFEFDPDAGAQLLLRLEGSLAPDRVQAGLARNPLAWRAWAAALADAGRPDEALAALLEAEAEWPDDLKILVALARIATRAEDWEALERWVARDPIPPEGPGLELLAFRARHHAESDRRAAAQRDLETLLAESQASYHLLLAGDVQRRLGEVEEARRSWNRALFNLPAGGQASRIGLFVRLAELEDEAGRASVALRHWRSVLEIEPDHARARKRIEALTGGR